MKRRRVRLANSAEAKLADVWEYIASDSVDRADRFIDRLRESCQKLGRVAGLGRPYPRRPGFRCYSTLGYLVLYRVSDDFIEIAHIVHGARDLEAYLDSFE